MDKTNNQLPNIERLLRATDVAEVLNVSPAFAYQLMQKGQIPSVRIGGARRVRLEDLTRFIEKNTIVKN